MNFFPFTIVTFGLCQNMIYSIELIPKFCMYLLLRHFPAERCVLKSRRRVSKIWICRKLLARLISIEVWKCKVMVFTKSGNFFLLGTEITLQIPRKVYSQIHTYSKNNCTKF